MTASKVSFIEAGVKQRRREAASSRTYLVLEVVDNRRLPLPRLLELRDETSDFGRPVAIESLGARHLGPVAGDLDLDGDFEL